MSTGYLPGHQVRLLVNGMQYFPALINAIDQARIEVLLETYLFAADGTGESVYQALLGAARRGVRVRVLLDGYGAQDFPPLWADELHQAGARLLFYRPYKRRWARFMSWHSWTLGRYSLRRLHRKITSIDGRIAFVGGINIIDDWDEGARVPRLDFSLEVCGPLLPRIRSAQASMWRRVSWSQLRGGSLPRLPVTVRAPAAGAPKARLAFVLRDNIRHRHSIERMYLQAISAARERIVIANAYFLPGWRFRNALMTAAARGVDVHILLQGWADFRWVQAATRAIYPELLEAGIHLYEYQPAHVHAKVMVVDREWATVGSSNIDPLSLLLAREANIAVQDKTLATQLDAEVWCAMREHSLAIDGAAKRSRWMRMASRLTLIAARLALRLFPTRSKYRYWDIN